MIYDLERPVLTTDLASLFTSFPFSYNLVHISYLYSCSFKVKNVQCKYKHIRKYICWIKITWQMEINNQKMGRRRSSSSSSSSSSKRRRRKRSSRSRGAQNYTGASSVLIWHVRPSSESDKLYIIFLSSNVLYIYLTNCGNEI